MHVKPAMEQRFTSEDKQLIKLDPSLKPSIDQKMQNIVGASLSELIQEYYVTDELMSDVTSSKFNVQCKLTQWTPHYLTPRRWTH